MDRSISRANGPTSDTVWADKLLRHPYGVLLFLYLLSVAVRVPLVFAAGDLPFIFNDEMRYMHIAKSILSGQVLIRNQPVIYRYLLYPLALSPAYLLPEGINVFRGMQVINAFFMHSMIFPLYALAGKITKNRQKALLIAAVSLLLPDTALVKNIMSETLAYPMIFLTLFFIYEMFDAPLKTSYWVRSGVFCFLLYTVKPVYACIGAACFIAAAAYTAKERDRSMLPRLLAFAGVILVAFLAYMGLLKWVFGMNPLGKTHYDAQNAPLSLNHLLLTLKGMLIYVHYHLIAFYILPPIALLCAWKRFEPPRKLLAATTLLTLLLTWLLTVYVIYVDEQYAGGIPLRVHIRYTTMLFPVLLAFLLTDEAKGFPLKGGVACLAFLGVGLVSYNVNEFVSERNFAVDSMMMALLNFDNGAWDGGSMYLPILLSVLVPVACVAVRDGLNKRILRVTMTAVILGLCLNQYAAYTRNQNYKYGDHVGEAEEMVSMTGGSAWMVCDDGQEDWAPSVAIDVQTRCEMPIVTLGALLDATKEEGSVEEVLPIDMGKYVNTVPTYPYSLCDYMIFDVTLLDRIAFAQPDQVTYSSGGLYAYVPVSKDSPWIHSVLYGLNDGWVTEGSHFSVYDANAVARENITLRFSVKANADAVSLILCTDDGQRLDYSLTSGSQWIEAIFEVRSAKPFTIKFYAPDEPVCIETYLVMPD